jgi:hypothetical protein
VARSVAELLPRPFAELTLDDVARIIEAIGDERETLFFERKAAINTNALAKACCAFANTYGGLLVVGVGDDDDTLVGIEPVAGEAQLWVKDALCHLALPMPPFRARWLPTDDGRGLLLVLVEESSTTPHLLTRNGAIYVRNPGSSDPVPITDHRRLLDLTARGERAAARAVSATAQALNYDLGTIALNAETLVLAATGIPADFEASIFSPSTPEALSILTWGEPAPRNDARRDEWRQDYVGVERYQQTEVYPLRGDVLTGVLATRDGAVSLSRSTVYRSVADEPAHPETRMESDLRSWFEHALAASRDILLEHGAHGDASLLYQLRLLDDQRLYFDSRSGVGARELPTDVVRIELETTLDADGSTERVFAEIARSAGLGPLP